MDIMIVPDLMKGVKIITTAVILEVVQAGDVNHQKKEAAFALIIAVIIIHLKIIKDTISQNVTIMYQSKIR